MHQLGPRRTFVRTGRLSTASRGVHGTFIDELSKVGDLSSESVGWLTLAVVVELEARDDFAAGAGRRRDAALGVPIGRSVESGPMKRPGATRNRGGRVPDLDA